MPVEHVIFDCDGVLVDSEPLANEVLEGVLRELGVALSHDELERRYTGLSDAAMWVEIEREWGNRQPADFDDRFWTSLSEVFDARLRPLDGVAALLAGLPVPASVASNSALRRVRHSLAITGLAAYFQGRLHSAEQVARPKPAPDVYLQAASGAGAAPASCLVVEDSSTGVKAARAAGMIVVGYTGGSHCGPGHAERLRTAGAHRVIGHYRELTPLLTEA